MYLFYNKSCQSIHQTFIDDVRSQTPPERLSKDTGLFKKFQLFWTTDPTPIPGTNLFLGSAKNAADYDSLKRNNIKMIINVTSDVPNFFEKEFIYHRIHLLDISEDSLYNHEEEINNTLEMVKEHVDGNILIHCMMGASRSVGFVCLYIMDTLNINLENTYAFVKEHREAAAINKKFYTELETWNTQI
jgi:hypothetical protein